MDDLNLSTGKADTDKGPFFAFSDSCPRCANLDASIPLSRVMEKIDRLFENGDLSGAERLLLYWRDESEKTGDLRALFSLDNELMGHFRKTGKKEKAVAFAEESLSVAAKIGILDRKEGGTAYMNAATVYEAFGMPEKALSLFEEAKRVLEKECPDDKLLLAGLYNNMALSLSSLDKIPESESSLLTALRLVRETDNGRLEEAVTLLNLADLYDKRNAETDPGAIESALDLAEKVLIGYDGPRGGYYRFVCEKCRPVFSYYGRFFFANYLKEEVERPDEGN